MTRQMLRHVAGSIFLMLLTAGGGHAQAWRHRPVLQGEGQTYLAIIAVSSSDLDQKQVGEGQHLYRFVVRDANEPNRPWRHAPYQVGTRDGVKWEGGPEVHQGVTDARGRTAVFRSKVPLMPSDWMVLPLRGQGKMGMSFRLVDQDENGVADHPYLIDVGRGPLYCGKSLPGGHTARVQTAQKADLRLYTDLDETECRRLSASLNPVMAEATVQRQIKGLQRLIDQGWSLASSERIKGKLTDLLMVHGEETQIGALVNSWRSEPGISRKTLAERLNSAGYGLVEQRPPRLPELAERLLAEGKALEASPAIVDSHAWALHALGRHEEALQGLDAAIEGFQQMCTEEHEGMYQETLAHRAQVLADLGRTSEAFDAWVRVYRINPQATWASSVSGWAKVSDRVKEVVGQRETDGGGFSQGCADVRDQRFLERELHMPVAAR